jgi:RNA polymerase sigma-70 factor (ECF subfamily)
MHDTAQRVSATLSRQEEQTAEAIRRANAGDRDGFSYLYVRYAPHVHAYVRRIVANSQDAEDVTQQVFLKLITRLHSYEPQHAQFSTWMLRVARNTAIDHLRRDRLTLFDEPFEPALEAQGSDPDCRLSLREMLASLPPDQRDVLLLRDVAGLPPGDVATRLGKTPAAVNTSCHRARRSARRILESKGWAPVTRKSAPGPAA